MNKGINSVFPIDCDTTTNLIEVEGVVEKEKHTTSSKKGSTSNVNSTRIAFLSNNGFLFFRLFAGNVINIHMIYLFPICWVV